MVNKKLIKAAEAVEQYHANVPATQVSARPGPIPTPLYVTQHGKSVMLKFKTQEEADAAWRMLSALAEAHADRTHAEQDQELRGVKLIEEIRRKYPTDTDVED